MSTDKRASSTSGKNQPDKFKELARELETDESPERFDERLKRIAKGGNNSLTKADQKQKPGGHPVKKDHPEDQ